MYKSDHGEDVIERSLALQNAQLLAPEPFPGLFGQVGMFPAYLLRVGHGCAAAGAG